MNEEMLEVLKGIRNALDRNYLGSTVETPGIVEGGFMRLHDKMDNIESDLGDINQNLKTIADALVFITGVLDSRL